MPIYEYRCERCGRVKEVLAKPSEADHPPQTCTCGEDAKFVKLFSTFATHATTRTEFPGCGREGCEGGNCGRHFD
jgi:putative FmdB family regulatory protein